VAVVDVVERACGEEKRLPGLRREAAADEVESMNTGAG
jgi:hypothetical protein